MITYKQKLQLINDLIHDKNLNENERKLFRWIATQNNHKHLRFRRGKWNIIDFFIRLKK